MPTVFVPHQALRFSTTVNRHVPVIDISKAAQFGNIVVVTESSHGLSVTQSVQEEIKAKMAAFKPDDFILAVGDPVAIAACAIEAARLVGDVQFLKWDRGSQSYFHEKVKA